MKLVEDWKQCWRWLSIRGLAILIVIPPTWAALPPDVKAFVPTGWEPWVLTAVAVATAVGRLIPQGEKT